MNPAFTIRSFVKSDSTQVAELWHATLLPASWWNQPDFVIDSKLKAEPELLLVAETEKTIVGTVIGGYDGHRAWIYNLAVQPTKQKCGVGRALVYAIEKKLAERGAVKVNLQVRASNESVVAFYKSLGFFVEERVSMGKLLR